jgi:hypothetical protein
MDDAQAKELVAEIVDDVLIPDAKVRRRYGGISKMTLHRWDADPDLGFPPPVRIQDRKYRRLRELLEFERLNAQRRSSRRYYPVHEAGQRRDTA